jgi:hypothetical protein
MQGFLAGFLRLGSREQPAAAGGSEAAGGSHQAASNESGGSPGSNGAAGGSPDSSRCCERQQQPGSSQQQQARRGLRGQQSGQPGLLHSRQSCSCWPGTRLTHRALRCVPSAASLLRACSWATACSKSSCRFVLFRQRAFEAI